MGDIKYIKDYATDKDLNDILLAVSGELSGKIISRQKVKPRKRSGKNSEFSQIDTCTINEHKEEHIKKPILENYNAAENLSSPQSYEYQFIAYFTNLYTDLSEIDTHNILSLNCDKLRVDFLMYYRKYYYTISKVLEKPDRHKMIAILTKAFLDASPFESNYDKLKNLIHNGEKIPTVLGFPNEFLAPDICKIVLAHHAKTLCNDSNCDFKFPNKTYLYSERTVKTDYEYELYLLYRHYITTKKSGESDFSIYQMAHVYFLLEMGSAIARYGRAAEYYNIDAAEIPMPVSSQNEKRYDKVDMTKIIESNINILEWLDQNPEKVVVYTNANYNRETGEITGDIVAILTSGEYSSGDFDHLPDNFHILEGSVAYADNRL